jgi:putative endonuclease
MYVYICRCSDKSYYTGVTNNAELRVAEHNEGIDPSCYTFTRRPLELVYVEECIDPLEAIAREKQIKGWTRVKKETLINQDFEKLKELSRNRQSEKIAGRGSTGSP